MVIHQDAVEEVGLVMDVDGDVDVDVDADEDEDEVVDLEGGGSLDTHEMTFPRHDKTAPDMT